MNKVAGYFAVALLLFCAQSATAQQQGAAPTPQDRVAQLKASLQASQASLHGYEWVETTTFYLDGEEKGHKQNQVYYGADGKLQKVPVAGGSSPPPKEPIGPLRRHAMEQKKEDLTDYMQQCEALIHQYLPPDADRIQAAVNDGRMSMDMLKPGKEVRLNFHDYLKPGDVLGIAVDITQNSLTGMNVNSYLDSEDDAVTLEVQEGVLADGTVYTARTTLNAEAKDLKVVVENSGYRKQGG